MLHVTWVPLKREKIKALLVPVCEDKPLHTSAPVAALVEQALSLKEFSGKKDQEVILYRPAGAAAERVIFRGLGKAEHIDAEAMRQMAGKAVKRCIQLDLPRLWVAVPEAASLGMQPAGVLTALMEGAFLGNHIFNRYQQKKEAKPLARIEFVVDRGTARQVSRLPAQVEAVCRATVLARDWVNMPANEKAPEAFAALIAGEAKAKGLSVEVLAEKDLRRKKMGALLAVAAGSAHRPALVVLQHRSAGRGRPVVLVGKGVTFDSGGINLKTGDSLPDMKADMAGAAAVAAVLIAAAEVKLKRRLVGVIPLVENMVSGRSSRPGDIVQTFTGKTVEIGNTDAEGRLILIDALAYAEWRFKPETIVDVATLTGACVVALGEGMAGVFSRDAALQADIVAAGSRTHERCWPLPMPEDYKELLKSAYADINNVPRTRYGGAISAALFLSEFVQTPRWAHIDIAGPAFHRKESAYCGAGGRGFGVRLLIDWLTASEGNT
jgi:leucyl aminopeptidase